MTKLLMPRPQVTLSHRVVHINLPILQSVIQLPSLCRIYAPFSFLKINHTVWDEGAMSCTCTGTLTCTIQMLPMKVTVVLGPVIITSQFLEFGQLDNSQKSWMNSWAVFLVQLLDVPCRVPVSWQIVCRQTMKHQPWIRWTSFIFPSTTSCGR
jgi:hypothetical protein